MGIVKIKLMGGSLPKKMSEGAAAFDCFSRESSWKDEEGYLSVKLGFAIEVPEGYCAKLYPRSSVSNAGLILANSVGIIDSDYRGEVQARFYPSPLSTISKFEDEKDFLSYMENVYAPGKACCQLRIEKNEDTELVQVEELSLTDRGEGGFGSTDVKEKKV